MPRPKPPADFRFPGHGRSAFARPSPERILFMTTLHREFSGSGECINVYTFRVPFGLTKTEGNPLRN